MNSAPQNMPSWPEISLSSAETETLFRYYNDACVILEYGSGGSTVAASEKRDKLVFSVESDHVWAIRLQYEIDLRNLPSPALVYHVDIGPTGHWGRPLGPEAWTRFHRYPLAIWDEPFFRQPDVILIDGRFRPACLLAVLLRTQKPVTVLFDDYAQRPAYHSVEAFLKPTEMVGRMAVFDVEPRSFDPSETGALMAHFFRASYHGRANYSTTSSEHSSIGFETQIKDQGHD